MILVRPSEFSSFEGYLAALSKSARKNWKEANKRYGHLPYTKIPFVREEVDMYMKLWSRQLVRGKTIEWAYPVGYLEGLNDQGRFVVFRAFPYAMQYLIRHEGFWQAEPILYDKRHSGLATWMWFKLFQFAVENSFDVINMGGGTDESWRDMVMRRDEFPNPFYKWRYVPRHVKENPETEPNFKIKTEGQNKRLEKI